MIRAISDSSKQNSNDQHIYAGLVNRIHMTASQTRPKPGSLLTGFTSCHPREGVSTVTLNVCEFCARELEMNVLLIDASGGTPLVESVLELDPKHGLLDVLDGSVELDNAVMETGISHFHYLASGLNDRPGFSPKHSVEFTECVAKLRHRFDMIFVDLPPATRPQDGLTLAPQLDGTVLVVQPGRSRKDFAKRTCQQFGALGIQLVGVLMNKTTNEYPSIEQLPLDAMGMVKSIVKLPFQFMKQVGVAIGKLGRGVWLACWQQNQS